MKREETIDFNIKAAWHAIARMYNQQALKYGGTMSVGFALLNIHSEEGTPATKIGPLMGLETKSLTPGFEVHRSARIRRSSHVARHTAIGSVTQSPAGVAQGLQCAAIAPRQTRQIEQFPWMHQQLPQRCQCARLAMLAHTHHGCGR